MANVERIRCFSTLLDSNAVNNTLFRHPLFGYTEKIEWPPENWKECRCWHCVDRFSESGPVPLVHDVHSETNIYSVYGIFCSFSCAKAYLLDQLQFSHGNKFLMLDEFAETVYGIKDPILPAPPRQRLKIFGGDLTYEEFHSDRAVHVIMSPPMISFPETYLRQNEKIQNASEIFFNQTSHASSNMMLTESSYGGSSSSAKQHSAKLNTVTAKECNTAGTLSQFMKKPSTTSTSTKGKKKT